MNKKYNSCIFLVLCMVLISCGTIETVSKEELMARTRKWKDSKIAVWYYTGSSDRYDYFLTIDKDYRKSYRVALGEISLNQQFPLTHDQSKWVIMPWGPN